MLSDHVMSWIISSNCYRFFLLQRQLLLTKYVEDLGQMHTACVNAKVFVSHVYLTSLKPEQQNTYITLGIILLG